jgi:hypothetical protein
VQIKFGCRLVLRIYGKSSVLVWSICVSFLSVTLTNFIFSFIICLFTFGFYFSWTLIVICKAISERPHVCMWHFEIFSLTPSDGYALFAWHVLLCMGSAVWRQGLALLIGINWLGFIQGVSIISWTGAAICTAVVESNALVDDRTIISCESLYKVSRN